jgi:hypothetical protein
MDPQPCPDQHELLGAEDGVTRVCAGAPLEVSSSPRVVWQQALERPHGSMSSLGAPQGATGPDRRYSPENRR